MFDIIVLKTAPIGAVFGFSFAYIAAQSLL